MNYLYTLTKQTFNKKTIDYLPEIFLGFVTVWLRLVNLGYSDFQGDEIKALFLPESGQNVSGFLLDQRKGPIQFFVTYLLKFLNPAYDNQLIMRLPFALAGILAVFFFYKFIKIHFGRKIALLSSFFIATNGFLVAFSRIVQYQSFVILFMILALFVYSLAVKNPTWKVKGIYLGTILWALSILSHYDGLLIAPFVGYLMLLWIRKYGLSKHLLIGGLGMAVTLSTFYIPFVLSISKSTQDYWLNRISGGGEKISSSKYLFRVYHPIYVIHVYTILAGLGGLLLSKCIVLVIYNTVKGFSRDSKLSFAKFLLTSVTNFKELALLLWFLVPFFFLEVLINIPGTHIYTYLLPLTVILAYGVKVVEWVLHRLLIKFFAKTTLIIGVAIVFTFMSLQSHAVFVDHYKEYPWENESFLIWEFYKPTPIFHLSMFGFPYYRHWEEIGQFVRGSENNGFYSTNERTSISRYHIPFQKDTNSAGHFIHIINPQSFTNKLQNEKAEYWAENYEPVLTFVKNGKDSVRVYYMPAGDLVTIKGMGY